VGVVAVVVVVESVPPQPHSRQMVNSAMACRRAGCRHRPVGFIVPILRKRKKSDENEKSITS
jgi:hypothetical protein